MDHHNGTPKPFVWITPFVWIKKASAILEKEARARNKFDAVKNGNQLKSSGPSRAIAECQLTRR